MATLTDTARISRMVIKFGGIALGVMMIGRFSIEGFARYWKATHPPTPPPPNVAFGALPAVVFPEKQTPQLLYQLELPTGVLPTFSDRANVYLMPDKRPRLGALDSASADAQQLGFKNKPTARTEVVYRYTKQDPLPTTLDMNIYTGKFTMAVDWTQDPNFFTVKELPSDEQAINEAKQYLQKAELLPNDLEQGQAQITYLKASGSTYKHTVSLSEADFIQVDLFRAAIDKQFDTATPDPTQGVVRVIFSGNRDKGRIVEVDYNYYPIDATSKAAYPLKTPETAWAELQGNKGYIARLNPAISTVTVRRLELQYYDSYEPQPYLQPVYVFKGDDNFVAYIQAIPPPSTTVNPLPTAATTEGVKKGSLLNVPATPKP